MNHAAPLLFLAAPVAYHVWKSWGVHYDGPTKTETAQKPATAYEHSDEKYNKETIRTTVPHRGERHRHMISTVSSVLNDTPYNPVMDMHPDDREEAIKSLNIQERYING